MASGAHKTGAMDGVRVVRAGRVRRDVWGVVAVGLGVIVGLFVLRSGESPPPPARPVVPSVAPRAAAAAAPAAGPAAPAAMTTPIIPKTRGAKLRALRAAGITPTRGPDGRPQIAAGPVIEALNAAGIHDGIAVFPPPGTDPPKSGIIVPDDFDLPEGYVRHHQVTDEGQALPPILMFHPDYEFTDANGNPIAIPPDRVVPPELAPPGLPIQLLEIPERDRPR